MRQFQELFLKVLKGLFAKFKISEKDSISTLENLSRYIFSKSHFNATGAKYAAFMPRNGETSVFRISDIPDDEIWDIGENHVGENIEPSLKGRADIVCSDVKRIGLDVVPETSNHPLHANIVSWPAEKDAQLELAIMLAKTSNFSRKPL